MKRQIVIIGAGIIGLSTAYYLAKNQKIRDIVIIDRNNPMSLTSAASGENYRNWWPQIEMFDLINRSIDLMEDIARATKNRINMTRRGYALSTRRNNIDALIGELNNVMDSSDGKLLRHHTNFTSSHYIKSLTQNWEIAPGGVDILQNRQLIQSVFPSYAKDVQSIIHIRRGGDIDSQQLGQIMIEYLRKEGVKFIFGNVLSIQKSSGYEIEYNTAEEIKKIKSEILVNAAGPHAREVASMLGVKLDLVNVYQQKIAFEDTLKTIPRDLPFSIDLDPQTLDWSVDEREYLSDNAETSWLLDTLPGATHCRPDGGVTGSWVKLGWAYNQKPDLDPQEQKTEASFPEVVLRGTSRLQPSLKAYYGKLPSRRVHYGGWYNMTNENWPLIGPMKLNGAFMNCAMSGFGTMASCAAGELCAKWIAGDTMPSYATNFSFKRYDNLQLMQKLRAADKGIL